MRITVEVLVSGQARPPVGAPVLVQVRDTALQDAPARILAAARGVVEGPSSAALAIVRFDLYETGAELTVWAHVDVDGDGRVSSGDYITTQSYPLPAGPEPRLRVAVVRV
ncbi:MAG: YbaY family lipoprotein [Acidobacteria bacterium]|nr:YbaY family lipoprotein [Acidobacteriota bacterium]